jgi:uncharacterized protein YjbI with pentapeptide repeats
METRSSRVFGEFEQLDRNVLFLLIGIFVGAVLTSIGAHLLSHQVNLWGWADSVLQNTGTEMLGAALTFYLIEVMLRKRREQDAERRAIEQEKQRLVLQLGSPSSGFAVEAARILKARGWGFEGDTTLRGVNLVEANLHGANLRRADLEKAVLLRANLSGANQEGASLREANLLRANLQEAALVGANLQETNLFGANLRAACLWRANLGGARLADATLQEVSLDGADLGGTDLSGANLDGADLREVNLEAATLREANLQGAYLTGANLRGALLANASLEGASLYEANLREADFAGARLDEKTTLPDDTKWTPDADLTRFTDPAHPAFWHAAAHHLPGYPADDDA